MEVKANYLTHKLMQRYKKIIEAYFKDNHNIFDEALYTTMPIDNYFDIIDNLIQYAGDGKQPYTPTQIINNAYNRMLATDIYMEPNKMWRKKPASEKNRPILRSPSRSTMTYGNSNA